MNAKTAKMFRKYAREETSTKEDAKIFYKELKAKYKEMVKEHG